MSIVFRSEQGWLISHQNLINHIYNTVKDADEKIHTFKINSKLFNIEATFDKLKKSSKRKLPESELEQEQEHAVDQLYKRFRVNIRQFLQPMAKNTDCNMQVIRLAERIYHESGLVCNTETIGENSGPARLVVIKDNSFLFPENSKFYCNDVAEIAQHLREQKFNVVLLDPPWWNKYIRRKKMKTNHAYKMMYNEQLKEIPVETFLCDPDGFVVVWCTNSQQNFRSLCDEIFPKWKVHFVARAFWLKITCSGEPICKFSKPPGKQPYEQIVFGSRNPVSKLKEVDGRLVVSVPSALHSHKPPLTELLKEFLPDNPACLEIFARYLLPNWTSWGLEALKFQHETLYDQETSLA